MKTKSLGLSIILVLIILFSGFAQKLPQGFSYHQLASFDFPVSMAFSPDGRLFVLEEEGFVRIYENGKVLPEPAVELDSVFYQKQKGLLGIAFDPNFSSNGYVYFYHTVDLSGNSVAGIKLAVNVGGSDKQPIRNKIVRYTLSGNKAVADSKKTILDLDIIPGFLAEFNHDGGTLHFGQDGKLYVAVGENTMWCADKCMNVYSTSCNCQNGWIVANWSQMLNSFHGKILRLNADGTPPLDNPFYTSPGVDFHQKYLYAIGLRNPFSFHFRPGTNDIYLNDVGSSDGPAREEINILTPTGGKNFGFPEVEGIVNNPLYVDPIKVYPHRYITINNVRVNQFPPGSTLAGCAITGGTFFSPASTNWPIQYLDKYFYLDFCDGWINMLDVDTKDTANFATELTGNLSTASSNGNGPIFLETGIDGQLYHLVRSESSGASGLYRISYQPVSVVGISISVAGIGDTISETGGSVQFNATISPTNASLNDIFWTINSDTLAGITQEGLLTAKQNGIVTITATSVGNPAIFQSKVVTISGQIPLTSISIQGKDGVNTITAYQLSLQIEANYLPIETADKELIWSVKSSNSKAYINQSGLLFANGYKGILTVTATAFSTATISGTAFITSFSEEPQAITAIGINQNSIPAPLIVGQTITLTATVMPENASNSSIVWSLGTGTGSGIINSITGVLSCTGKGSLEIVAKSTYDLAVFTKQTIEIKDATLSTTTEKSLSEIIVYPNPNSGEFTIAVPANFEKDVAIYAYNEVGQLLYYEKGVNISGKKQLNLRHLGKGLFRLSVVNKDGAYHVMILIQ